MVSIKDVAKSVGVSISTVSNVINQTKYVSPALVQKVNQAIIELGYEVDPIARNMKSGKANTIGVITADITGLFYPYVIKGIYEIANRHQYTLTIFDLGTIYRQGNELENEYECFKSLLANRVDGIIFASSVGEEEAKDFFAKIKKRAGYYKETAFVSIERDYSQYNIDSIFSDNQLGAEKAVQHLLEVGCENVCHITGPMGAQVVQERVAGYKKTLQAAGYTVDEEKCIVNGDYSHQSGFIAMEALLDKNPKVDGVFVSNDQMAIGVIKALQKHGRKVPEEIKVIGFDNVFISSIIEPSLSTVHIRKKHMGLRAGELLLDRIAEIQQDEKTDTITEELETRLVVRQSTKKNAKEDWLLADW